jgi:hypothetical protein
VSLTATERRRRRSERRRKLYRWITAELARMVRENPPESFAGRLHWHGGFPCELAVCLEPLPPSLAQPRYASWARANHG